MAIGHITFSFNPPASSLYFCFFTLSTQLSPPPISFCLYMAKAQQLLLSLSPSLTHCNEITLPVRSNTPCTHIYTHTHAHSEGKLVYNISCCNCSFLDCSSVTTSLWRKEQESSRYFVDSFWFSQGVSLIHACMHAPTHIHTHKYIPEGIAVFQVHSSLADTLHQWPAWVCVCPCVCTAQGGGGQVINCDVISCHCSKFQYTVLEWYSIQVHIHTHTQKKKKKTIVRQAQKTC